MDHSESDVGELKNKTLTNNVVHEEMSSLDPTEAEISPKNLEGLGSSSVVQCLCNIHKVLGWILCTTKTEQKEEKEQERRRRRRMEEEKKKEEEEEDRRRRKKKTGLRALDLAIISNSTGNKNKN
jgi:rRNA processing protein Gar1